MTRALPNLVAQYLNQNEHSASILDRAIITGQSAMQGRKLVDEHLDPMVNSIYEKISNDVSANTLDLDQAVLFIGELSVFARYNSTFLLRSADVIRPFCAELAQEFMRNYLEEAGEIGKLPAHYVVFSGALLSDLGLRVNGWAPRAQSTLSLTSIIDVLSWSHCPSTILGMYYATEAVATAETLLLQELTNRAGHLTGKGTGSALERLDYYYRMHLDSEHEAASQGIAVEQGHQEGIAYFIEHAELFGFLQPQIIDGFLQMFQLFVDQWVEVNAIAKSEDCHSLVKGSLKCRP